MPHRSLSGLALCASLVAFLVLAPAAPAQVSPGRKSHAAAPPRRARAFDLFGGVPGAQTEQLAGNRVRCTVWDMGLACANPFGSGTVEDGFWPAGTEDAYVFDGGLQVGAVVPADAGFKWARDTVGVFFFDARGPQRMGSTVSGLFDSRNASDLAVWPAAAYANDTSLFDARLIGRQAVSDQDTWVRYWDGDPRVGTGRSHMMGVVVDQRTLAFNRGYHQDILYFIYRLINVTSRQPQTYAGLGAAGYSAAEQQQLAALGAAFQDSAQARDAALRFPAAGYTFHNLYVGYSQDPDVGYQSDHNFSTAVLPFDLVAAMKSNYSEPLWQYPSSVYGGAFARAPGYVAVKFLRSAVDSSGRQLGIRVWSNVIGAAGAITDPVGVWQMYRYLAGTPSVSAGDWSGCSSNPVTTQTCSAWQSPSDTRYFESTGPMDLAPGQSVVIAVAMIFAAPLAQWAATTNGVYAMPADSLQTYVSSNTDFTFLPGWPSTAESLAVFGNGPQRSTWAGSTTRVRDAVERPMGWGQFSDVNGDGRIEANEVQTVPGSLLSKAQYAQALFDRKFLMAGPPDAPAFLIIPGDGRVTIAWQKSATEMTGDPFFVQASDPTSGFYDPDFRRFDVEGYRIWRGTSASNLKLIAQLDYRGTVFTDYTGQIYDPIAYGIRCAPELGITASCPAFPHAVPLVGNLVQVPPGGRIVAADGTIFVSRTDTAVTGGGSRFTALVDDDVPFVFTDSGLTNGMPYVYAVTAFDVNSVVSGPSSLESPLAPRSVTPRVSSGQETAGALGVPALLGGTGSVLDPGAAVPTLDSVTGTFAGPMPPANTLSLGLAAFAPQLVDSGAVTVAVDSVVPSDVFGSQPAPYFLTVSSPGVASTLKVQLPVRATANYFSPDTGRGVAPAAFSPAARSTRYGGDSTFALYARVSLTSPGAYDLTNWGRGSLNGYGYAPPSKFNNGFNGPRWWAGTANENTANPNGGVCSPADLNCGGSTPVPNLALTAGSLPGTQVMLIEGYATVPSSPARYVNAMAASLARAADFRVYWAAGGTIDSVVDLTHHVPVPFKPLLRASWGILTDSSFTNTAALSTPDGNTGVLTWQDIFCIDPVPAILGATYASGCTGTAPAFLMNHARLSPVVFGSSAFGVAAPAATGNGFIFYVAGQFFLMQMAALPAPGTVWNLRTYAGTIVGNPGGFAFVPATRPPAVPGLRIQLSYRGTVLNPKSTNVAELAAVHTVPDPYYNHSAYETQRGERQLRFVNLPAQCIIRIYSASGILVTQLAHNDATGGGEEPWDLTNRGGREVASGVYFYHVETPDRRSKVGRLTIVKTTD